MKLRAGRMVPSESRATDGNPLCWNSMPTRNVPFTDTLFPVRSISCRKLSEGVTW